MLLQTQVCVSLPKHLYHAFAQSTNSSNNVYANSYKTEAAEVEK